MGIIQTDQWLEKEFNQPIKICDRLTSYFKEQKGTDVYQLLLRYGMYKPSGASLHTFRQLQDEKTWARIKKIYQIYKKKWSGPEIPVFIFPLDQSGGFFRRVNRTKSGVSFTDKMFLFLSTEANPAEMEALFVHEYHHVCRLNHLKGDIQEYTLLDSMIIEGLAEYAVLKNCGQNHLADWCEMYSETQIDFFWERFLKRNLFVKKKERLHDELLYGYGRFPKLAGYAAGFAIAKDYFRRHPYSTKKTFSLSAQKLISETKYNVDGSNEKKWF